MFERVLLVEDDPQIGAQVLECLQGADFLPFWVTSGTEALRCKYADYSLVVLDLMLPGASGLEVLEHIRQGSDVPVLILSALEESEEKVKALELGADDFVTKPFWPNELLARIRARLRRPVLVRGARIEYHDLSIDTEARVATAAGTVLDLTRVEFDLLVALARRPGAAVPRSWLARNVMGSSIRAAERTLDTHVSHLRTKLGPLESVIGTVWGVGYRFETPENEPE